MRPSRICCSLNSSSYTHKHAYNIIDGIFLAGHVLRKNENGSVKKNAWIIKWKVYNLKAGEMKLGVGLQKKVHC